MFQNQRVIPFKADFSWDRLLHETFFLDSCTLRRYTITNAARVCTISAGPLKAATMLSSCVNHRVARIKLNVYRGLWFVIYQSKLSRDLSPVTQVLLISVDSNEFARALSESSAVGQDNILSTVYATLQSALPATSLLP